MENLPLQKWALVAEIAGGIAVVLTLLFLALQVRENSNLIRANAFAENMQSVIDWRIAAVSNEPAVEVISDRFSYSDPDALRASFWFQTLWNIYEKSFYSYQYGLIGEAEWERFEFNICSNYRIEMANNTWNTGNSYGTHGGLYSRLTPEFAMYVEGICTD